MLYLSEKTDNWNEGLNPELTSDMHLIYPFHNLYEHTCFSIFDLLWVRDFNVKISVEYDYATYKEWFFSMDVTTKIFFVIFGIPLLVPYTKDLGRITQFWGNDLATVLFATFCFELLSR